MSVCIFLAADCELPEKQRPEGGFCIDFDPAAGTVFDGDRDDDYGLFSFRDVGSYSELRHGAEIEWFYCTPGRAKEIVRYIKAALEQCDRVELWKVWLGGFYEYDERPSYRTRELSVRELTAGDVQELVESSVWEKGGKKGGKRPVFHCLTVVR